MGNSHAREKWWLYLILILAGVVSLPLGIVLIMPLSEILTILERVLCDAGWCGFDILWAMK